MVKEHVLQHCEGACFLHCPVGITAGCSKAGGGGVKGAGMFN